MRFFISLLYDFFLFFSLFLFAPKWLMGLFGKNKRMIFRFRGSYPFLKEKKAERIWIHAVSLGEMKAIFPLIKKWKEENPERQWVISTVTKTGYEEAKKLYPFADALFFLPFDFSWMIRPMVRYISPTHVVLSETDYWFQFLRSAKELGAKIIVVNGKISKKSFKRWSLFPSLAKNFFSCIDFFCLQSSSYEQAFSSLGIAKEKMAVTENLKFDANIFPLNNEKRGEQKISWGFQDHHLILTIASTHFPEEDLLLSLLTPLLKKHPSLHFILVPRHPDREKEIVQILREKKISFRFIGENLQEDQKVTFVNRIGKLIDCYQISDLALVGGSFTEKIGGHNILEPCFCHIPTLFGPFMDNQKEMLSHVLSQKAGLQVSLQHLYETIDHLLSSEEERKKLQKQCSFLHQSIAGSLEKTTKVLKPYLSHC